jgi:hypothetical protein
MKLSTADKLLTTCNDLELNAAQRWAALEAAGQLAAEAGDLPLTLTSIENLARFFDIDPTEMEQRAISELFRSSRPAAVREALAEEAARSLDRAVSLERYTLALDLLAAWQKSKKKLDAEMNREIKAREIELKFYRDEQQLATAARAKLREEPDDREAHAALGRYLLLVRDQPAAAVVEIDKGADLTWRDLARAEQAAPLEPAAQVKVGEMWWQVSERANGPLKTLAIERAAGWYNQALSDASGPPRNIIDKRRTQIANLRKSSNSSFSQRHPLDAVKIADHWYKFFSQRVTWSTARAACARQGGVLLCLESAAESQAVSRYAMQQAQQASLGERLEFWLGGSDARNEGTFVWLDGSPVGRDGFVNWMANEPNNGGGDEDHIMWNVRIEQGQLKTEWADAQQNRWMLFICEWDH